MGVVQIANIVNYSKKIKTYAKNIKCESQIILNDKKLWRKIQKTLNYRIKVIIQREKNYFMKKS